MGSTIYWRVRDNLLQYVSLEAPPGRFTAEVAIQPLMIPSSTLVLAFGGRLGRFVDGMDHWYETSSEDALTAGLSQVAGHLQKYAMPWFRRLDTVRALVDWYSDGATGLGGPRGSGLHGRLPIWLGYCHAYLGDYSRAALLIEENLNKAIRPEWPDYQPTSDLLSALRDQPAQVHAMLEKWVAETRGHLKLAG